MNGYLWNTDFHQYEQKSLQQQHRFDEHATLRYDDVAAAGPPARPLEFPAPTVHRAAFINIAARDHRSGSIHHLTEVLIRSNNGLHCSKQPDTAYLPTKKLSKSIYGSVKLCIVLKRIGHGNAKEASTRRHVSMTSENHQDKSYFYEDDLISDSTTTTSTTSDDYDDSVQWESTDYLVAVKFSEWNKILHLRGKHLEDPIKECAALQLLGNYHPHVVGALEVLQDDHCLYTVMPYLGGGELYGRLLEHVGYRSTGGVVGKGKSGFDESLARTWFRQLLLVSV
jgi:serine/threonine protein kinase